MKYEILDEDLLEAGVIYKNSSENKLPYHHLAVDEEGNIRIVSYHPPLYELTICNYCESRAMK